MHAPPFCKEVEIYTWLKKYILCFEIRLSLKGLTKSQNQIYALNLSIYFPFPWASLSQYTVRATAIITFRAFFPGEYILWEFCPEGFCPWGFCPKIVLENVIFRGFFPT